MLPFLIGLALGAGLTKNKTVYIIFIVFVIMMILKRVIGNSATKLAKSKNKTKAAESIAQKILDSYVDFVESGFKLADGIWDTLYGTYIFVLNVFLVMAVVYLAWKTYWQWAFICFVALNVFMIQNQVWRKVKR